MALFFNLSCGTQRSYLHAWDEHIDVKVAVFVLIQRHFCPIEWKKKKIAILLDYKDNISSNNFTAFKTSTRIGLLWILALKKIYPTPLMERCIFLQNVTSSGPPIQVHANTSPLNDTKLLRELTCGDSKRKPASQLLFMLFFLEHGACKFDSGQTRNHNLVAVS